MGKNKRISEEEQGEFRHAVADVRPLKQGRVELKSPRPRPFARQRLLDEREVIDNLLSDAIPAEELETGDELLFARPGLQHNVLRRLRRGHYPVQRELDLHGHSVIEARLALSEFITSARRERIQCVRIIHGKGNRSLGQKPILKWKVNHWLQQRDEVLAFCSARPLDGGIGAIYLLLRR